MEHQATVDKGLKMKIKRKNLVSKAESGSPSKHEIIKDDGSKVTLASTSSTVSSQVSGASVAPGSNATANNSAASAGALSISTPSTLDKLKQTLADKERDRLNCASSRGVGGGVASSAASTTGANASNCRNINKRKSKSSNAETMSASNQNGSFGSGSVMNSPVGSTASGTLDTGSNVMVELHRMNSPPSAVKKEPTTLADPYEFSGKDDDPIGLPVKKVKLEKTEGPSSPGVTHSHMSDTMDTEQKDMSTETCSIGVATDPDCLGPCEPGTSVVLEGIVWNETENGILVVNITWRGKTYVGTLMDATKHAWAPPRFSCESPANGPEVRTPRGRGKRGRNAVTPPVIDLGERRLRKRRNNNTNPYAAPPSPVKSEVTGTKRRGRPADLDLDLDGLRSSKRPRTGKTSTVTTTPENGFIECPEPNCSKKYRHINGLRYHQAHAHKNDYVDEDTAETKDTVEDATEDTKCDVKTTTPPATSGKGRGRRATASTSSDVHMDTTEDTVEVKTEIASPGPKAGRKSRKEEKLESKKQLEKQPTVALTPVSLADCHGATSVAFQHSPGQAGPATASAKAAATVTTTASTEGKKKSKAEKAEKKGKKGAQAVPVSSPAQISIAASHPQNANGLKPIQPKPTVLGETNTVTQALAGLKEKKQKKKKNKDKDKEKKEKPAKDVVKQEHIVPSSQEPQTVGVNKSLEALVKMSTPPELQKQALSGGSSTLDKPTGSPPELQKQVPLPKVNSPLKASSADGGSTRPPSRLSVNSPVPAATAANGAPATEAKDSASNGNAHSPAYSDISDANDSNCVMDTTEDNNGTPSRPVKVKEEPRSAQEQTKAPQPPQQPQKQQTPSAATNSSSELPPPQAGYHSGMYGSYFQGQYQNNSTPQGNNSNGREQAPKQPQHGNKQAPVNRSNTPNKDMDNKKPREDTNTPKGPESKPEDPSKGKDNRVDKDGAREGGSKPSPTPAQMREYQERMMAQQMAQYHQYMGAYGYGVDMRLLASNPEYKAQYEKWFMEQGRARREYMEQQQKLAMTHGKDGKDPQQPLDLNTKAMDLSKQSSPAGKSSGKAPSATVTSVDLRNSPVSSKHGGDKSGKDQGHPDQQRMMGKDGKRLDGHGFEDKMDGRGGYSGYPERPEDYRRFYMYPQQQQQHNQGPHPQQQRMMDHKRLMEQQGHHKSEEADKKQMDSKRDSKSLPHPMGVKDNRPDMHPSYKGGPPTPGRNHGQGGMDHGPKMDKEKLKSSSSMSSSPGGNSKKDAYGQFYGQQPGYPGYKVPGYNNDPSQPMYPQGNNGTAGYVQTSYPPYPPHMRGSFPEQIFKEGSTKSGKSPASPGSTKSGAPNAPAQALQAPEGKALELLQQKAANYRSHSPQKGVWDKADKTKDAPTDAKTDAGVKDKDCKSPPTQRHVHTHHHTHVVGPAYSLYGPSYNAIMASPPHANGAPLTMGSPPK